MRADGRTDMKKLTVAFRNFANSPKIGYPRLFLLICQPWFFSRVAKQSHLREINLVSQTPLLNAKFKKCGNGLY
jgi:hypothetical protein